MNRNQRVAASGVAAMLARVAQVGPSLFTFRLCSAILTRGDSAVDDHQFGIDQAAFADFGVSNTVAKAFGEENFHDIRQAVSSGFAILCSIALCVLLAFRNV